MATSWPPRCVFARCGDLNGKLPRPELRLDDRAAGGRGHCADDVGAPRHAQDAARRQWRYGVLRFNLSPVELD